ncbi:MAG: putative lipid II flippase MurJ [Phycisphaerae bacterium]|nr:putative lipid II flippase MurJ [Phycisphaerae bacterium]
MSDLRRIVGTTRIIALLTLGSRLVGLAREMMFAHFFSAGPVLSAFRVAFMIPNVARRLFGEGALSSSLVPVLTEVIHREGDEAGRRLSGAILVLLTAALTGLTIFAEVALAIAMRWTSEPALKLTAMLLPYMLLICVTATAGGVLNVRGHFASPAAAPVIMNLALIAGALVGALGLGLADFELMTVVCGATLISGVAQVFWQLAALQRVGFTPRLVWDVRSEAVRRVFSMMGPMILGLSTVQVSSVADYLIAYLAVMNEAGERVGPAVLGYAQYLYQLPLGVFGIALATAVFPVLSARAAAEDQAGLAEVFSRGMRLSMFISLPAAAGMIIIAEPIVRVLFERGAFGRDDTARVAGAVVFYAIGIPAYGALHVIVRAFYALKDSATPMRVAAMVVGLNLALGVALVLTPLQERGIALATAATASLQVVLLAQRLGRRLPQVRWRPILRSTARQLIATGLMSAALLLVPRAEGAWGIVSRWGAVELISLIFVGLGTYAAGSLMFRVDEIRMLVARVEAESGSVRGGKLGDTGHA